MTSDLANLSVSLPEVKQQVSLTSSHLDCSQPLNFLDVKKASASEVGGGGMNKILIFSPPHPLFSVKKIEKQ